MPRVACHTDAAQAGLLRSILEEAGFHPVVDAADLHPFEGGIVLFVEVPDGEAEAARRHLREGGWGRYLWPPEEASEE